jgi:hypothetical protein
MKQYAGLKLRRRGDSFLFVAHLEISDVGLERGCSSIGSLGDRGPSSIKRTAGDLPAFVIVRGGEERDVNV